MFLLNAIFHIGPLKKNHLKFRQIQIVTVCTVKITLLAMRGVLVIMYQKFQGVQCSGADARTGENWSLNEDVSWAIVIKHKKSL